jgi:hypothetical protein
MTTADDAKREIRTVMEGGRCYLRDENKLISGINRSMSFETIMRDGVTGRLVRFQVVGEFKRIPPLIQLSFGTLSFHFLFLQFLFTGEMAAD